MKNVYDTLIERGFIEQATHADEIRELLGKEQVTFYIGFDPTADSLTVGHFVPVMAMAHLQKAGHRPVALLGGGTGFVGDPTAKTEMRRLMPPEEINKNIECFRKQFEKFMDFSDGKAILANNADWLLNLNYIDFIRQYGVHFTISRMINAECYKSRLDSGLSFFEFNYMIMQSYDFLELFRRHNCTMQMGGNDQWSNIIGGVELIRRVEGKSAYGLTFKLLQTSEGKKMGKSEKGAVWLDPNKTSPYEFFQYWRNVADADVKNCLCLLTFLSMEEINDLTSISGSAMNKAKEVLAFEITKIIHGEKEAELALSAAKSLFGGGKDEGSIPTTELSKSEVGDEITAVDLCLMVGFAPSKSEARRIISQGGLKINDLKVDDITHIVKLELGSIMIQKGKKTFHKIIVS